MKDTQLVFVVGSGRCGTKMIKKLLAGVDHIEARHEYVRNAYQRDAALYYLGRMRAYEIALKLVEVYQPAAHYSEARIFLDSSHKLAWVVDILADVFPNAKFIHLVRDGRKVVESFYYKLNIFGDYPAQVLRNWMSGEDMLMPPLEEKFWQPASMHSPDMFQRICWHWSETNRLIKRNLPAGRGITVKLEELTTQPEEMTRFLAYLDTPFHQSFMEFCKRPDHVYVPIDYKLTSEQQAQFNALCGEMMTTLGYAGKEEYSVKY